VSLRPHDIASSRRSFASKETPLVNRIEEMTLLKDSTDSAVSGEGCIVVLLGEPGIGKTRLTRELQSYARSQGMQVLYGRCPGLFNVDSTPPYVIWKEVMRDYLQRCTLEQLQSAVGYYPSEICKIVPDMKQRLPAFTESPLLSPELEKDRLFEAVSQFVENVSKAAPLLLILDDLQWCDPSSLALLHYLARGVYRDSLLVLGTYRDVEVEEKHPLFPILTDLKRAQLIRSIRVKRFSLDEVTEMIRRILLQDDVPLEFCERVFQKTQGTPFFVEEVVQSLKEEGIIYPYGAEYRFKDVSEIEFPATVTSILQARIGRLDDETQQVMTIASFIGKDFTINALQCLTGLEEGRLTEIVERMMDKKLLKCIIVRGEDICSFSDMLIRDAFFESVGPLRRKKLHGTVALALEKTYASSIDEHASELAAHFLEGGDRQKALEYFLKAGEKAQKVYANNEAASYYQSALNLLREKEGNAQERASALEALGGIQELVGKFDASLKSREEALPLRQQLGQKENVAGLYYKIAHVWAIKGDSVKAEEYFGNALEILAALPEGVELANLYAGMSEMFWRSMEPIKAIEFAEKAIKLARSLNAPEVNARANLHLGAIHTMNDRKKAVGCYEEALRIALNNGDMENAIAAYSFLGSQYLGEENREKCLAYAQKGYEMAKKVGAISAQAFIGNNLAGTYVNMGNMDAGLPLAEESVTLNRKTGNLNFLQLSLIELGNAYTILGEYDKGEKLLREGLTLAQKMNNTVAICMASVNIGFLLIQKGEYFKAKEFDERAYSNCERAGAKRWQARFLLPLIRISLELGELEEAENQLNKLQEITQQLKDPSLINEAVRFKAMLLYTQKKYDESLATFDVALQTAERLGDRRWNASNFARNILFRYALLCLERNHEGDRQKARNLLSQALEMFRNMRAKVETEKTEALLRSIEKGNPITFEPKPISLIATGYPALDTLLHGGLHSAFSLVLTSPSCDERDALVKSFLETGAKNGETTFYLTTDPSLAGLLPEEFASAFYLLVCNPQAEAIVKAAPNVFTLKGIESLTNINIALTQVIRKFDPMLKTRRRICISLISDLLLQHGPVQTRKWLTELLTQLKSVNFTTLAVIDPFMHSSEQLHAILGLFDGEINIREAETDKGSARLLKVKRMSNQKYLKDEIRLMEE
jgi:predicted ATPase/KaiC/GvpD/RAD55 family RecA-like ATPase